VTGEGTDTDRRFKTHVWRGGDGIDFDLDLTSASFDTLSEVASHINSSAGYTCSVVTSDYGSLDSRGLRDVINKSLGAFSYIDYFGEAGTGDGKIVTPSGVCANNSHIFVTEMTNNRMQKFDKTTYAFVAKTSGGYGDGDDDMRWPVGVICDDTYVYVADYLNNRIARFNVDMSFSSHDYGTLVAPTGVTMDDDYLYIADAGNNRIQMYDRATFTYASDDGSLGSGNENFNRPWGITANSTHVFITDINNHRIIKRVKSGALTYVAQVSGDDGEPNSTHNLWGIACDDDFVYTTNYESNEIQKWTVDLDFMNSWSNAERNMKAPAAIYASIDSSLLYVGMLEGGEVQVIDKIAATIGTYSYAKLLALKTLAQKKDPHDRIKFDTSLYGLDQPMGNILYTRRIDEDRDTRMRVTQITRDPQNYKVSIAGRQEGIVLNNLIGRWQMTQRSNTNAPDTSGNGYTLTEAGTTIQLGGNVIQLDGGTEYFRIVHGSSGKLDITGSNPFTLVGKIKANALASTALGDGIIGKDDIVTSDECQYGVRMQQIASKNYLCLEVSSDGTTKTAAYNATPLTVDGWYTFAAVYNTTDIRIYLNGYLDQSATNPKVHTGGIFAGEHEFAIGRYAESIAYCANMDISYMGMFDVALNYEEIMYIHEYWK